MESKRFNPQLFVWWILLPIISYFMKYFLPMIAQMGIFSGKIYLPLDLFEGLPGFVFNMLLLGWAVHQYRLQELPVMDISIFQDNI